NNQLTVTIVPSVLLLDNENYIYETLLDKTEFKIYTRSKGNLIIRGKNTKWKLIPTEDFFSSLPFDFKDYKNRFSTNNNNLKYQELKQIYEEMLAKKTQLSVREKESKVPELSKILQKQLENPFYQTVKLCVYIKQVDAQ